MNQQQTKACQPNDLPYANSFARFFLWRQTIDPALLINRVQLTK
jgi:hypothetical protein